MLARFQRVRSYSFSPSRLFVSCAIKATLSRFAEFVEASKEKNARFGPISPSLSRFLCRTYRRIPVFWPKSTKSLHRNSSGICAYRFWFWNSFAIRICKKEGEGPARGKLRPAGNPSQIHPTGSTIYRPPQRVIPAQRILAMIHTNRRQL